MTTLILSCGGDDGPAPEDSGGAVDSGDTVNPGDTGDSSTSDSTTDGTDDVETDLGPDLDATPTEDVPSDTSLLEGTCSEGLSNSGSCTNSADCALIESGVIGESAISCTLDCGLECVPICLEDDTGLSPACGECYQLVLTCGFSDCVGSCQTGQVDSACVACLESAGCVDQFAGCSGFDVLVYENLPGDDDGDLTDAGRDMVTDADIGGADAPDVGSVHLSFNIVGTGAATISDDSVGLACGRGGVACEADYSLGARIELTVDPFVGSQITAWEGVVCEEGAPEWNTRCTFTTSESSEVTVTASIENNLVFTSSEGVDSATLGEGGDPLAAADAVCNRLAGDALLPGTYRAWLSTMTPAINASDRLEGAGGLARGWIRMDGLPFADSISDLVAGEVFHPILYDETGAPVSGWVLTGTQPDGTGEENNCDDYTNGEATSRGGLTGGGTERWTKAWGGTCSSGYRIYCFGVDVDIEVAPATTEGLVVFIAGDQFLVDDLFGVSQADALCASSAAGNLTGTFRAVLATDGISAPAHVFGTVGEGADFPATPIVSPDGLLVSPSSRAFFSDDLIAPVSQLADGSYVGLTAWTGIDYSRGEEGVADNNCANWTDDTADFEGRYGYSGYISTRDFLGSRDIPCWGWSDPSVYCMQVPE